jgi:2-C-methyl-D-erythritol 4-phosphate cytidylyltransferase
VLTAVVVPAAGAGVRLGAGVPKALALLDGEPLLTHALRSLAAAPSVGAIVVSAPAPALAETRRLCEQATDPPVTVVAGGASRQASVASGLAALPHGTDVVLVHDAARALVPPELVERVIAAVRAGAGAVVPALPVTDTVKQVRDGVVGRTVDRADLVAVQTPQGFRRDVLERAHAAAGVDLHTDDAGLVERLGGEVVVVPGHPDAVKITTPADVVAASVILASRPDRA